ncbi:MAG: SDR family NAD(P)-dependent oxidoreductase [Actinomycetota bacterium]
MDGTGARRDLMDRMRWEGKVCLVTGASSGFGQALALRLARLGATVVAAARREERLRALVEELGGPPHSYIACDLSDLEQIRSLASQVGRRWGHIDLLVNNAGVRSSGPFLETTSEEMERVLRIDLLAPIFCTRELVQLLQAAPGTSRTPLVVNLSSMGGRLPVPGSADYTAAKFGLVGFTESIWHELGPMGIKVMMVNPGPAETEGFPMAFLKSRPATARLVMDADRVARSIVRGVERGAFEVRVQWWWHPLYLLSVVGGPLRRKATRRLGNVARSDF